MYLESEFLKRLLIIRNEEKINYNILYLEVSDFENY